jgi:hypothetical protein
MLVGVDNVDTNFWSISLHSGDFVWIFGVSLFMFGIKSGCKYITKFPVFLKDPRDPVETKAARFECLRLGLDLSFLGLVAAFAVFRVALNGAGLAQIASLVSFEFAFIAFQFFLMVWAVIFTTIFSSPERHFQQGIWIPSAIGFLSIYSSVLAFRWLLTKGG